MSEKPGKKGEASRTIVDRPEMVRVGGGLAATNARLRPQPRPQVPSPSKEADRG